MAKHTPEGEPKKLGGYEVYPNGIVMSRSGWRGKEWRALTTHKDDDGYHCVRLVLDGKRKKWRLHRLMAELFLGGRPAPDCEVRHLDDDKDNNCLSNILWGTRKDNADDRERNGRTSRGAKHKEAIKAGIERSRIDPRLIAAAPELLSALEYLLFHAPRAKTANELDRCLDRARAAIAKAEGRTE